MSGHHHVKHEEVPVEVSGKDGGLGAGRGRAHVETVVDHQSPLIARLSRIRSGHD
jgi:hypothetical protein